MKGRRKGDEENFTTFCKWFECRTALRQQATSSGRDLAPGDTWNTSCFKSLQLFDLAGMDCPRSRVAAGAQSEKEGGCLPGIVCRDLKHISNNHVLLRTWPVLSRYIGPDSSGCQSPYVHKYIHGMHLCLCRSTSV